MNNEKYNPILSIIIPIYNADRFLDKCLESVVRQTLKNWELILIDDGSTDKSLEIMNRFKNHDNRIEVKQIENAGVSTARNVGLSSARGKYIGFVDADDWISEEMFENMVRVAENENLDIVQCSYAIINENNYVEQTKIMENKCYDNPQDILLAYFEQKISPCVFNKIFRKKLIGDMSFDPELSIGEDSQFIYGCCKKAKSLLSFDKVFYFYYQSIGSAMRSGMSAKKFQPLNIVDQQRKDNLENEEILFLLQKKEVFLCTDLILSILDSGYFLEKLPEVYERITKNRNKILKEKTYPFKIKVMAIMLSVSPDIFIKIYKIFKGISR